MYLVLLANEGLREHCSRKQQTALSLAFFILINSSQMVFSINSQNHEFRELQGHFILIGYARVSTHDQNLELQTEALTKAGCKKIFEDKISGSRAERPGLAKAQEALRAGDTLVVWNSIGSAAASSIS